MQHLNNIYQLQPYFQYLNNNVKWFTYNTKEDNTYMIKTRTIIQFLFPRNI